MSQAIWNQVKAADDCDWNDLSLNQQSQFNELVERGGDSSVLGVAVEAFLNAPAPAPKKKK